jgi:hypothetical protein
MARRSYRLTRLAALMIYETRHPFLQDIPVCAGETCHLRGNQFASRKRLQSALKRYYCVPYTVRANIHCSVCLRTCLTDRVNGQALFIAFLFNGLVVVVHNTGHTDLQTSSP